MSAGKELQQRQVIDFNQDWRYQEGNGFPFRRAWRVKAEGFCPQAVFSHLRGERPTASSRTRANAG